MQDKQRTLRFWLSAALIVLILAVAAGLTANRFYVKHEIEEYAGKFALLSTLRRNALENYFHTASAEIHFWTLNQKLLQSQREIVALWQHYHSTEGDSAAALRQVYITENPYPDGQRGEFLGPDQQGIYIEFHKQFHPFARRFVSERGYYDMFMISPQGNIFYSVEKEDDFATNLNHGPYRDTALAEVFQQAIAGAADQSFVAFSDIEAYRPSNMDPAMFMARALLNKQGELLGVLALQLPMNRLRTIMNFTAGMGESGETYLVGEDFFMRSDSRFNDTSTILNTRVETQTVKKALAGEQGVEFTPGYRGIEVLSAYDSLEVNGKRWAVMAEIDKQEVMAQLASRRPGIMAFASFLYALAMFSLWFVSPGDWSQRGSIASISSGSDFGDGGA
ncbi:MAG: cache domain-containing protein [Pseudomonadales bacterium]